MNAPVTTRRRLRELLSEGDVERVAHLAESRSRILGDLVPITYDADTTVAWRAVEAIGLCAARVADRDPGVGREQLRRLFWLLSEESGGICWRAPEAMAEIVRRRPDLYADWIPIVTHLLVELAEEDLRHFKPGVLWAIGTLGPLTDGQLDEVLPAIVAALDDPDPAARGMAVRALDRVGRADLLAGREDLLDDEGTVELYENRISTEVTVGSLAREARARA